MHHLLAAFAFTRMKIIERYVLGSFLTAFLLAWLVLTFVLSIGLLVQVTNLIAKGMPVAVVGRYFLACIPGTMGFTIPLAVLVAALLVFGRLSADSEISAMRACGVNVLSVLRWPLIFGALMSLLCFYIQNEVVPRSDEVTGRLKADAKADLALDVMEPGKFNALPGDLSVWFARREDDWLDDVLIFTKTRTGLRREIRATRAHVTQQGFNLVLDLEDVWIDPVYEDRPGAAKASRFSRVIEDVFRPANRLRKVRNYNLRELMRALHEADAMAADPAAAASVRDCTDCNQLDARRQPVCRDPVHALAREWQQAASQDDPQRLARLRETCARCASGSCDDAAHARICWPAAVRQRVMGMPAQIRVELHKRLAFSCAAFCFALIGMPLGIRAHRRESTVGVAIALGVALAFYLCMILADSFKFSPALHPHLLVWIPVGLCLAGAAILIPRHQ